MSSQKITIITVTFNNLSGLKETLKSVSNLSYNQIEHWVIDGGSNDGSADFLNSYNEHEVHFVSEADHGIYDAMNKGIDRATGEWIIFMNAGDQFYSANVLDQLSLADDCDIIYGNSQVQYESGFKRIAKPGKLEKIWRGMSFTHQALIVRTDLTKMHTFNTSFKYCADFDQVFSFYNAGKKFKYQDIIISIIEAGGVSDAKRHLATKEVYKINNSVNNNIGMHLFFIFKILAGVIVINLKKLVPNQLRDAILKMKYRNQS